MNARLKQRCHGLLCTYPYWYLGPKTKFQISLECIAIPVKLTNYLTFFSGHSRLRFSHMDRLSLVSSVLPRGNSIYNLNKSFFYRSHSLWNSLPLDLREIKEPSIFKFRLKQHLWKVITDDFVSDELESSLSDSDDDTWY